eukprot:comp22508_c0_seq1/m.56259 comp22508_c0_seq1/g.56259  ORF comp22508_c0_seq1/g.56259 comp22508_c0_seq1/m.56259 type:complete len:404 (-) comp22508_c0_seq1:116-1327(-)
MTKYKATTASLRQGPPEKGSEYLRSFSQAHIDSFNHAVTNGLAAAVEALPVGTTLVNNELWSVWVDSPVVRAPVMSGWKDFEGARKVLPAECRESGSSYTGVMTVKLFRKIGDLPAEEIGEINLGNVPIMVGSVKCNLHGMTPAQLVESKEEAYEWGGYFIINGNERIIRMLIQPRSNYVMAIKRSAFTKRGPKYSSYATTIRCLRPDLTAQTVAVHYLKDGTAMFRFGYRRAEFFLPAVLLLKSLIDTTDREIYEKITQGADNTMLTDRVEVLLSSHKKYSLYSREQCLAFIGKRFRVAMREYPDHLNDVQIAQRIIAANVFVHLGDDNRAKFDLLCFMIRKLYAFVTGAISEDNSDAAINFEIQLPGNIVLAIIKERLTLWVEAIIRNMKSADDPGSFNNH